MTGLNAACEAADLLFLILFFPVLRGIAVPLPLQGKSIRRTWLGRFMTRSSPRAKGRGMTLCSCTATSSINLRHRLQPASIWCRRIYKRGTCCPSDNYFVTRGSAVLAVHRRSRADARLHAGMKGKSSCSMFSPPSPPASCLNCKQWTTKVTHSQLGSVISLVGWPKLVKFFFFFFFPSKLLLLWHQKQTKWCNLIAFLPAVASKMQFADPKMCAGLN